MFEDIQKHRQAVRENIEKSLQIGYTESEDFEKAHKVGDIHPNGKWVWTQLPSGKFDWRVIKKSPANKKWWNESEIKDAVKRAYKFSSDISITEYGNNGEEIRLRGENFDYYGKITKISDSTFVAQGKTNFGNVSKNFNNVIDAVEFITRTHFGLLNKATASKGKKTEEVKEESKNLQKPIVPNAVIQYGNLPSRQFDQLYKDFDSQFKSYTKEQLSQAIDKIGDSVSKQISLYKRMNANGDSKIALNKQGNFIDQLSARVYTLKRLLNEKEK